MLYYSKYSVGDGDSVKTIDVLGICLKDYTLRDAMRATEQYMNSGALRTVICVTAGQLMKAADNAEAKNWLEAVDLVMYDDIDIIKKAEGLEQERAREAQNQEYLDGVFKKVARSRYGVFLLAENEEKLAALEHEVSGVCESLRITGRGILEKKEAKQWQADSLINDINNVVPRVIIAKLPLETERIFLERHRQKINANVFLGLSEEVKLQKKRKGIRKITRYVSRTILRRRITQYIKKGKAEDL